MVTSARILVVDDDPAFVKTLAAALEPLYETLIATRGSVGLELISRRRPDLVLLDCLLPDVPGLAVLRTAKKLFPSIPVIVMTGFGSEDVSVEAFRRGARDYLRKPFDLPDLLARIEILLAARQVRAEQRTPLRLETRDDEPQATPGTGTRAASLQRAVAFIEANSDSNLTLDQVAREAGMSKCHFCRVFKAHTGITFRDHLNRRRIVRATELLQDQERSVTDVCLEVGFNDMSHFARVFRRLTGHPPSRFRTTPTPHARADTPPSAAMGACIPQVGAISVV